MFTVYSFVITRLTWCFIYIIIIINMETAKLKVRLSALRQGQCYAMSLMCEILSLSILLVMDARRTFSKQKTFSLSSHIFLPTYFTSSRVHICYLISPSFVRISDWFVVELNQVNVASEKIFAHFSAFPLIWLFFDGIGNRSRYPWLWHCSLLSSMDCYHVSVYTNGATFIFTITLANVDRS